MRSDYQYDVFLSFAHQDNATVNKMYLRMTKHGLRVYFAERKLEQGRSFPTQLENAIPRSQHFVLYCSQSATKSQWVSKERDTFLNTCHMKDLENRRMYVLQDKACPDECVPALIESIQRSPTLDDLIAALVNGVLKELEETTAAKEKIVATLADVKKQEVLELNKQLDQERRKAEEARGYYRHSRFWSSTAESMDVHILTCGRDVGHANDSSRGYGGRTNIDMWDYMAVLDIRHYFASKYPGARITIEDPISKLHDDDLKDAPHLADRIAYMRGMLADKDCIIVGSPDVSDFAEIVLARIHKVVPYTKGRVKRHGFVIIKERKYTPSSFYWQKEPAESEGVAQILGSGEYEYFPHRLAQDDGTPGEMHGILIVASNPFCGKGTHGKITILSGFSGVATNAIAKLLTDETWLREFFKLDNAYVNLDRDIEALIGVQYVLDRGFTDRDTRRIVGISFERLVEI